MDGSITKLCLTAKEPWNSTCLPKALEHIPNMCLLKLFPKLYWHSDQNVQNLLCAIWTVPLQSSNGISGSVGKPAVNLVGSQHKHNPPLRQCKRRRWDTCTLAVTIFLAILSKAKAKNWTCDTVLIPSANTNRWDHDKEFQSTCACKNCVWNSFGRYFG